MIEKSIRWVAVFLSAVIVASFLLFAIDQTRDASNRTQAAIAAERATSTASPEPADERAREREHGSVREAIDDGNDILTAPFAGLVDGSSSRWARRGVPSLLALLLFGVGLGFVARYAHGRGTSTRGRPHKPAFPPRQ